MTLHNSPQDRIKYEANEWHSMMHSGKVDDATRHRFEAWLQASKDHKDAYWEFEQIWRDLDLVAPMAGVDTQSVKAMDHQPIQWRRLFAWAPRPALAATGLAAALVLAVGVGFSLRGQMVPSATQYVTQVAQIRDISLPDGSVVTLGAKSRVEVDYTAASRQITLLAGEAFFDVQTDEARPFFVAADDTLVRVVGTQFGVKRGHQRVHVSVLEGVVEVMKPEDLGATLKLADTADLPKKILTAGGKVIAPISAALPPVTQVDATVPAGAWREGRLAYKDASLAEIVSDMNRYRTKPVRFASPEIGDIRLTAAFQASEINGMLRTLETLRLLEVVEAPSGEVTLRHRMTDEDRLQEK